MFKYVAQDKQEILPVEYKGTKLLLILLFVVSALMILSIIALSAIVFHRDDSLSVYGVRRIKGIPYNQKIINENEMQVRVLRLKAFNSNKLQEGDYVVVPNSKNADYLWGAKVLSINFETEKVVTTVNDAFEGEEEIVSFSEIEGIYAGTCGFFGQAVYFFSQRDAFIFLVLVTFGMITSAIVFWLYLDQQNKRFIVGD